MKQQTLIALGIAVILGLVAVFIANTYLTGRERQLASSPQGMVRVAVASLPLDFGSEVSADKVKFVNYPAASLPPGTFRSIEELIPAGKTRVALRPILVNQPLLASDVTGEGENASIAALLPDGMRAVTVRVDDVSGVAGFIKPNDTVDVLITRQATATGDREITDVLLQNVRVVATGQDAKGADEKPQVARSATLEVTPLDAQKLVLGQQLGRLSLVLRKPGAEQDIDRVATVSLNDLRYNRFGSTPPTSSEATPSDAERRARIARLSQPRAKPAPPKPPTKTVSVTRGTETSTYEVGGYAR